MSEARVRTFGELSVDETYQSAGRTVTEADIASFAGISGDFNPLHTDAEWVATNTDYERPIAHGLLVLAMSSGLRTPGIDELNVLGYPTPNAPWSRRRTRATRSGWNSASRTSGRVGRARVLASSRSR